MLCIPILPIMPQSRSRAFLNMLRGDRTNNTPQSATPSEAGFSTTIFFGPNTAIDSRIAILLLGHGSSEGMDAYGGK